MGHILVVGIGGAAGAITRYSLNGLLQRRCPDFLPAGTLVVNVLGCLIIGMVMVFVSERSLLSETAQRLLVTGFLGSMTTFSAFGYETVELIAESNLRLAFWNVAANVCIGFGAVIAGRWLMKLLVL